MTLSATETSFFWPSRISALFWNGCNDRKVIRDGGSDRGRSETAVITGKCLPYIVGSFRVISISSPRENRSTLVNTAEECDWLVGNCERQMKSARAGP